MMTAVLLTLLCSTPDATGAGLPPEALGAPPRVDETPTAWACTVDTLQAGRECVFEAEVAPSASTDVTAQAAGNVRTLQEIGPTLCAHAAKSPSGAVADRTLVALCQRNYADAAEDACGLEGSVPVIDARGRFAPAARGCYRRLSAVLQDTLTMATVATACCQCAARSGCPVASNRCHEDVARQEVGGAALTCLARQCGDACSLVMPASMQEQGDTRPARPQP
ncbi:MAG TPA: hypothetical protein VLQ93_01505 [Myxococcaceae bacterium]|nr:hypothetical protein [Myxococcaceae bacterium]